MIKNENKDLYELLQRVIPEIPDQATKLVLTLEMGCHPVIECEFIVSANIGTEIHEQKYTLTPIDGTLIVR
jgi:hypothetical protein